MSLWMISDLTNLGAAGIMGAMWLWERRANRQREEQLSECHARIQRDEQRLSALTETLERNSAAFSRFSECQRQFEQAISHLVEELRHAHRRVG